MRRAVAFLLLSLCVCAANAQTITVAPTTDVGRALEQLIDASRLDELRWPDFSDYRKHLRNFYAPNGYALAWTRDGRPTPQALDVIALFKAADAKGINAVDYDAPRWDDRIHRLTK